MTITFDVSVSDLVAFNQHAALIRRGELQPLSKVRERVIQAVLTLVVLGLGVLFWPWGLVAGVLVWYLVAWLQAPVYRWLIARSVGGLYAASPTHSEVGSRTLTVDPSGVAMASSTSTSRHDWSAVQRVATSDGHVFIYLGVDRALIVPRAAILPEQFSEFMAVLRNHAPSAFSGGAA